MSAILAVAKRDVVHVISDAGAWTADGRLARIESKIHQGDRVVIVGRGSSRVIDEVLRRAAGLRGLDALLCILPAMLDLSVGEKDEAKTDLVVAGWSDDANECQLWRITPRKAQRLQQAVTPTPDAVKWARAGVRKLTDPEFDPVADGVPIFELMRQAKATPRGLADRTPRSLVAGFCESASVDRNGVRRSIVREWPEDVVAPRPADVALVTCEESTFIQFDDSFLFDRTITIDNDVLNFNLRTVHDSLFPAIVASDLGSPGVALTCIVAANAHVGSASTSLPAFDVGDWDVLPPITIVVRGRVQGAGAEGGGASNGLNGQPGGTALKTRVAINLDDASGQLWGGGGGGAAINESFGSRGGGGGAGNVPGPGGGGTAVVGSPGTTEAGGLAAAGSPSAHAGNGGNPGQPGDAAVGGASRGSPGAAGAAIDGVSHVTTIGSAGDRRGGQVN